MLEGLGCLVELQRLDDRRGALEAEREGFVEARSAAETRQKASGESVAAARGDLERLQGELRVSESGLADQETLLRRLEGQQSQVKTNTAYTTLLHEMDGARQAISAHETAILEHMDAIEEAGRRLAEAEAAERELARILEAEEQARVERGRAIEGELEALGREREALLPRMGPELLTQYERVAGRRSPAVVVVSQELCLGCRVGIPPQQYLHLLSGERVITCGSCRRILIAEAHLATGPPDA